MRSARTDGERLPGRQLGRRRCRRLEPCTGPSDRPFMSWFVPRCGSRTGDPRTRIQRRTAARRDRDHELARVRRGPAGCSQEDPRGSPQRTRGYLPQRFHRHAKPRTRAGPAADDLDFLACQEMRASTDPDRGEERYLDVGRAAVDTRAIGSAPSTAPFCWARSRCRATGAGKARSEIRSAISPHIGLPSARPVSGA